MAVIDRLNVNQTPAFLKDGVFDISEYNNGAVYTDLSDALGHIPSSMRKGGMSVKFIQSNENGNKYVQYRLKKSWSSYAGDWEPSSIDTDVFAFSDFDFDNSRINSANSINKIKQAIVLTDSDVSSDVQIGITYFNLENSSLYILITDDNIWNKRDSNIWDTKTLFNETTYLFHFFANKYGHHFKIYIFIDKEFIDAGGFASGPWGYGEKAWLLINRKKWNTIDSVYKYMVAYDIENIENNIDNINEDVSIINNKINNFDVLLPKVSNSSKNIGEITTLDGFIFYGSTPDHDLVYRDTYKTEVFFIQPGLKIYLEINIITTMYCGVAFYKFNGTDVNVLSNYTYIDGAQRIADSVGHKLFELPAPEGCDRFCVSRPIENTPAMRLSIGESVKYFNLVDELEISFDILNNDVNILKSNVATIFNTYPYNLISGINTNNPSSDLFKSNSFRPLNTSGPAPASGIVDDTISPFKDLIGKIFKIKNLKTEDCPLYPTSYIYDNLTYDISNKKSMEMSYWLRQVQDMSVPIAIFGCYFYKDSAPGDANNRIAIWPYINTDCEYGYTNNFTAKIPSISDDGTLFNCTITVTDKIDDWVKIFIKYDIINPNNHTIVARLINVYTNAYRSTTWIDDIDIVNQQFVIDETIPSGKCVLPDNKNLDAWPESLSMKVEQLDEKNNETEARINDLEEEIDNLSGTNKRNKCHIDFTPNSESYIISNFYGNYRLKAGFNIKRLTSGTTHQEINNNCLNFTYARLVDENDNESAFGNSFDDIAPENINGTYIGANHGCSDARRVTCSSPHGLNYQDIGSQWTNGSTQVTIIGIISPTEVMILPSTNNSTYPLWSFAHLSGDSVQFTHISGATHTSSFTGNLTQAQIRPASVINILKVFADGIEITENGDYNFNELVIQEQYDVVNPAALLEYVKQHVGEFTHNMLLEEDIKDVDKVTSHNCSYIFQSSYEWVWAIDYIAYQPFNISYYGYIQQPILPGNNCKLYIPRTLPIIWTNPNTHESVTTDFRQPQDHSSRPVTLNITKQYWEDANYAPDRYLEYTDVGANFSGFLPDNLIGGVNRKNFINNAFFLYTSRKVYPYGIDSLVTINAGDVFSGAVFRNYIHPNNLNIDGVLQKSIVKYKGNTYMYVDFTNAGKFIIPVPQECSGMNVDIVDKSDNIQCLTKQVTGGVILNVANVSPFYGSIILKLYN